MTLWKQELPTSMIRTIFVHLIISTVFMFRASLEILQELEAAGVFYLSFTY